MWILIIRWKFPGYLISRGRRRGSLKSMWRRESENMESWRSFKFLETSTKRKLFVGRTILPNFSVKIFAAPNILQIKECTKCRPRIYWPEFKNAIIQDWLMQMCWNLACEPFSWKILCLWKKINVFLHNSGYVIFLISETQFSCHFDQKYLFAIKYSHQVWYLSWN